MRDVITRHVAGNMQLQLCKLWLEHQVYLIWLTDYANYTCRFVNNLLHKERHL